MSEFLKKPLLGEDVGDHLMVVNTDIEVRYAVAAEALNLNACDDARDTMVSCQDRIVGALRDNYDNNIFTVDAVETREALDEMLNSFKQEIISTGKRPIVISLDPIIADQKIVDYIFQESRASLVAQSQNVIDLEHNPRGYVNRFINYGDQYNGAGKTASQQLAEIRAIITNDADTPTVLAIVEDYIHSGGGILNRFKDFIDDPDMEVYVFAGIFNQAARSNLRDITNISTVTEVPPIKSLRRMDVSDLIPTLGGRPIGVGDVSIGPQNELYSLLTTKTDKGVLVPVAVDAICGNYPWQVDIYPHKISPIALRSLGDTALYAAESFWGSLEAEGGSRLSWADINPLSGLLKVHYPIQDLTPIEEIPLVPDTPLGAVFEAESRYNRHG